MARVPAVQEIEESPEADRLEGFLHPRHTAALFGHADAERTLTCAFNSGRIHHAWLICGRSGIGKATLAYRFASFALAHPEERDRIGGSLQISPATSAARQVRALSHPGLLLIRRPWDPRVKRFPATIPIDEVRRLRSFLNHSAAEMAWRVVIVDTADELNINAANALLKSLEEPPARTVFLLISSEPGRLLATIRSRCRRLDLAPLASQMLREASVQAITAAGLDQPTREQWNVLESIAEGSVRRLVTLATGDGLAIHERVSSLVTGLPKVDWRTMHTLSDDLGSTAADQRFQLFYDLLLDLMSKLVHVQATGEGTPEIMALAQRLIGDARLAQFAGLWETVTREKAETLALNLDRKTLILSTVSRLESATQRVVSGGA